MSTQKRSKQERTIRFPVSAHYNLETGEKTFQYEDIPIGIYKEWLEGVVDGLARSYYEEYSFLLIGVERPEHNNHKEKRK